MREMGTVELLTREGEIRIAKRIEEGIYQVLRSLANYPETVQLVLEDYALVHTEEIRLSDIISGFSDTDEEAPPSSIGSMLEDAQQGDMTDPEAAAALVEDDGDDGEGGIVEVDVGPNPEQAKIYFDDLQIHFDNALASLKEHGRTTKKTAELLAIMSESFLKLKLTKFIWS